MSNNITLNEVWERIVATQNQLESLEQLLGKAQCVEESARYVDMDNEDSEYYGAPSEYSPDVAMKKNRYDKRTRLYS